MATNSFITLMGADRVLTGENAVTQSVDVFNDGDRNRLCVDVTGLGAGTTESFVQDLPNSCNANFPMFVAPSNFTLIGAKAYVGTAEGGTLTLQLYKDESTDAPGAGTALLGSAFNLNSATQQDGTLVANATALNIAAGDRISLAPSANMNTVAAMVVTIELSERR